MNKDCLLIKIDSQSNVEYINYNHKKETTLTFEFLNKLTGGTAKNLKLFQCKKCYKTNLIVEDIYDKCTNCYNELKKKNPS